MAKFTIQAVQYSLGFLLILFLFATCTNEKQSGNGHSVPGNYDFKNDSSILLEKDIYELIQGFANSNMETQNEILQSVYPKNKKLAETLLIYRNLLNQTNAAELTRQHTAEKVFLHYIINTEAKLPNISDSSSFNITEKIKIYGQSMGLRVSDPPTDSEFPGLHIADRTEACEICLGKDYLALRDAGISINKMRYGRPDVIPSTAFNFNSTTEAYVLEDAMILADFSNLAYFPQSFVKDQLELWGYKLVNWFEDKGSDTQGFIAGKNDFNIICFRGTSSITDAKTDAWFVKQPAFGGTGKVHKGFQSALESVWLKFIQSLDHKTKIYVTGHSLGAALALLAAHRLSFEKYNVKGVYTFGSPRVGNWDFKNAYDAILKAKTFLHINSTDIIPTIPMEILGFYHVGKIYRFNDDHVMITENKAAIFLEEKNYQQLDEANKKKINADIKKANKSLKANTDFMRTNSSDLSAFSYSAEFEAGKIDNHSIDQYLFKLACALVDKEWQLISKSEGAH